MAVAKFVQTDFTTQTASTYKAAIDADMMVAEILVNEFAPHEQNSPDMTIRLEAGRIFTGIGITWVGGQSTAVIAAPTVNPRIDRVVMDPVTGANTVIPGAEDATPVPPAITLGQLPVCRVLLQTTSTEITNDMLTDERALVGIEGVKPLCSVYSSADLPIADVTWTALTWDTEEFDTFGMHSLLSNTDRIVAPRDGKYRVTLHVVWEANAAGLRGIGIAFGTAVAPSRLIWQAADASNLGQVVSLIVERATDEYVKAMVYQSSGGEIDVLGVGVGIIYSLLQMEYLGP